jgi:hypothetical protein
MEPDAGKRETPTHKYYAFNNEEENGKAGKCLIMGNGAACSRNDQIFKGKAFDSLEECQKLCGGCPT